MNVKEEIARYLDLRAKKAAMEADLAAALEPINKEMEDIEASIKQKAADTGVSSFKTEAGTAFLTTVDRASVADWTAVLDFVTVNERYDMLTRGVNKTAVREYVAEHGLLPPGANYTRVINVNVRKPSTKVEDL